jgi:hypothetical protein
MGMDDMIFVSIEDQPTDPPCAHSSNNGKDNRRDDHR